ncbi:hypothetical protein JW930_02450 [Candidatus Woesearchaeota archaeon]|nr:hypothetical protein [Candidatus Woesearchaeota archaeon]
MDGSIETVMQDDSISLMRADNGPALDERIQGFLGQEVTFLGERITYGNIIANIISLVIRPLVGAHASERYKDNPEALALIHAGLIASDVFDGWFARKYGNSASKLGEWADIIGDHLYEIGVFGMYAKQGKIPSWVPFFYVCKDTVTDVRRYMRQKREKTGTILSSGRTDYRWERAGYALAKLLAIATAGSRAPKWLKRTVLYSTIAWGAYRAIRNIGNIDPPARFYSGMQDLYDQASQIAEGFLEYLKSLPQKNHLQYIELDMHRAAG